MTDPTRDTALAEREQAQRARMDAAHQQATAARGPCSCWEQISLHSGHCCFRYDDFDYRSDDPLPCGHTDPRTCGRALHPWATPDVTTPCGRPYGHDGGCWPTALREDREGTA